ncbi:MAG: AAA family ATPase, partial [Candidatus Eremiobacterota bacterium]
MLEGMLPPPVPGLEILEEIGRGARGLVYKGRMRGRLVALKVHAPDRPSAVEDLWFRREGAIMSCVRHPGLPEVLQVGESDGRPYLIRAYLEGHTLAAELNRGPLPADRILGLARTLAGALGAVHRHGLVHRDVKPQNIILQPSGVARLIDFGFAIRFRHDREGREVVGTMLYAAPEQTGMLPRPVDGRADLYALGVVLWECAVGRPPFQCDDLGELMRLHAVLRPPDLTELVPQFSPSLSGIVSRLLRKDPDDRYQTAASLVADLTRVGDFDRDLRQGCPPRLGQQDRRVESLFEPPLVGREAVLAHLRDTWADVRRGSGAAVVIEGPPGSGKSRLIRELVEMCSAQSALVLQGRSSPHAGHPFEAFRSAVANWLASLLDLPEEERQRARRELARPAGAGSRLLGALVPELFEPAELEGAADQFQGAAVHWFCRLAEERGGLLLVLDDIHWLDPSGHRLLARLLTALEAPLLVLLTSREADLGLPGCVARLRLEPLAAPEVAVLLSAYLGGRQVPEELVQVIHRRSQGNPFAVGEFVRAMLDEGLLRPCWGRVLFESTGLERLKLPVDVLQLVIKRLEVLRPESLQVLRHAALLGTRFSLDVLRPALGEGVDRAIAEASGLQLVERAGLSDYTLVHDRVREALLENVDPEHHREMHRRLALALERATPPDPFALARHYGLGFVTGQRVFETCYQAGLRALRQYGYEAGYDFLRTAGSALSEPPLEHRSGFFEAFGEACDRTRRTAEALQALESALQAEVNPTRRARLELRLSQVALPGLDRASSRTAVNRALRTAGLRVPGGGLRSLAGAVTCGLRWLAGDLLGRSRGCSEGDREGLRTSAQILAHSALVGYFEMDYPGMLEAGFRAALLSQRLGPSREAVRSYCDLMLLFNLLHVPRLSRLYAYKALELARRLGDPVALARTLVFRALGTHLEGRPVESERLLVRHLEEQRTWLDMQEFMLAATDLCWNLEMRGYTREALQWQCRARSAAELSAGASGQLWDLATLDAYAVSLLATLGQPREALECLQQARERMPEGSVLVACNLYGHAVRYHVEQGELGEPLEQVLADFHRMNLSPYCLHLHRRHFYVFQAEARQAQCEAFEGPPPREALRRFERAVNELRMASRPPVLGAYWLVFRAALERLRGHPRRALGRLEQAQRRAAELDAPALAFAVCRERALLYRDLDRAGPCQREVDIAWHLADRHGWLQRARRLLRELPLGMSTRRTSRSGSSALRETGAASERVRSDRLLEALRHLSLASAQVLHPLRQARMVLDQLLRLLNAERAFLFLSGPEGLRMAAGRDAWGHNLDDRLDYSSRVLDEVLRTGQPVVLAGTEQGQALGSESVVLHGLRSVLAAPLLLKEEPIGVVYLDNRLVRGAFTEDDFDTLRAVASHVAVAVETARATELEVRWELEQEQRRLAERMRDLTADLAASLDPEQILARLLESLDREVPCPSAL